MTDISPSLPVDVMDILKGTTPNPMPSSNFPKILTLHQKLYNPNFLSYIEGDRSGPLMQDVDHSVGLSFLCLARIVSYYFRIDVTEDGSSYLAHLIEAADRTLTDVKTIRIPENFFVQNRIHPMDFFVFQTLSLFTSSVLQSGLSLPQFPDFRIDCDPGHILHKRCQLTGNDRQKEKLKEKS